MSENKHGLKRMVTFKTKRRLGGAVNSSLNKNTSLNSTIIKRTLRANNRDLAQALEMKKAELRKAHEIILQLKSSQMSPPARIPNMEEMIEEQVQKRIACMLQDSKSLGQTLATAITQLYQMMDRCSGGKLSKTSEAGSKTARSLSTGNSNTDQPTTSAQGSTSGATRPASDPKPSSSDQSTSNSSNSSGLLQPSASFSQPDNVPSKNAVGCSNSSGITRTRGGAQRVLRVAADEELEEEQQEEEQEDEDFISDDIVDEAEEKKTSDNFMNKLKNLSVIIEQSGFLDDLDMSTLEPVEEVTTRSCSQSLTRRNVMIFSENTLFGRNTNDTETSNARRASVSPKRIASPRLCRRSSPVGQNLMINDDVLSNCRESMSVNDRLLFEGLESPSVIFSGAAKSRATSRGRRSKKKRSTGAGKKSCRGGSIESCQSSSETNVAENDPIEQDSKPNDEVANPCEANIQVACEPEDCFKVDESRLLCEQRTDDDTAMIIDDSIICGSQPEFNSTVTCNILPSLDAESSNKTKHVPQKDDANKCYEVVKTNVKCSDTEMQSDSEMPVLEQAECVENNVHANFIDNIEATSRKEEKLQEKRNARRSTREFVRDEAEVTNDAVEVDVPKKRVKERNRSTSRCRVVDDARKASLDGNLLDEISKDKSSKLKLKESKVDEVKKKRSVSRSRSKDNRISTDLDAFVRAEVSADTSDLNADAVKKKFTASVSKPGQIVFSTVRQRDSTDTSEGISSAADTEFKKPANKSAVLGASRKSRSKPREGVTDEKSAGGLTKWDYKGTPPPATSDPNRDRLLSVFDLSLNDSAVIPAQKPVAKPKLGNKGLPRYISKDDSWIEDSVDNQKDPIKKRTRRLSASANLETSYSADDTILCHSPHGILLKLGNGKRTKPRSKANNCKFVSYATSVSVIPISDNDASGTDSDMTSLCNSVQVTPDRMVGLSSPKPFRSAITTESRISHTEADNRVYHSNNAGEDVQKGTEANAKTGTTSSSAQISNEASLKNISSKPASKDVTSRKRSIDETDLFNDYASPKAKIPSPNKLNTFEIPEKAPITQKLQAKQENSRKSNLPRDIAENDKFVCSNKQMSNRGTEKSRAAVGSENSNDSNSDRSDLEVNNKNKLSKSSKDVVDDHKIKKKLGDDCNQESETISAGEVRKVLSENIEGVTDSTRGKKAEPFLIDFDELTKVQHVKKSKQHVVNDVKKQSEASSRLKLKSKDKSSTAKVSSIDREAIELLETDLNTASDSLSGDHVNRNSTKGNAALTTKESSCNYEIDFKLASNAITDKMQIETTAKSKSTALATESDEKSSPLKVLKLKSNRFSLERLSVASNDSASEFRLLSRESTDEEGRGRRAAKAAVSYKEPSLGAKLRRGDPHTSTIYNRGSEQFLDDNQQDNRRKSHNRHFTVQPKQRQRKALTELDEN